MVLWPRALGRAQRILRHRDVRTTTAIYGHLDVEDLRAAVASLPASLGAPIPAPLVTRLLPGAARQKGEGPGARKTSHTPSPSEWALLVSNQRPPPCEDGALPLS